MSMETRGQNLQDGRCSMLNEVLLGSEWSTGTGLQPQHHICHLADFDPLPWMPSSTSRNFKGRECLL